jgi:hypothetical protein
VAPPEIKGFCHLPGRAGRPRLVENRNVPSALEGSSDDEPGSVGPTVGRWLDAAVIASGGAVLLAWLTLALVHIDDRYQVSHGQGIWMALAHNFNTVGLYPPIFDGSHYGGTRYMPMSFVLHGLVARVTGEYLMSGKLLGLVGMLALLVLVFFILRRIGCPTAIAIGLTATVMAGGAGLLAGTTIGGDVLPVLFQVGAVAVVGARPLKRRPIWAALLCSLALLSRFNALWAPLAIAWWLRSRDRRAMWTFIGAFVGISLAGVGLVNWLSEGRMFDNVARLATAGTHGLATALKGPYLFLDYLFRDGLGAWALIPIVALGLVMGGARGETTRLFLLSLLFSALVLVAVYGDIGTGPNQLVDVLVLTALAAGAMVAEARDRVWGRSLLTPLAAMLVIWISVTSIAVLTRPDLADAMRMVRGGSTGYPADPLKGYVTANMSLLSEDPGVPVQLGQTPVVFDPFMLLRIGQRDPAITNDLVQRIEKREFDRIILVVPLADNLMWWRDFHFGVAVVGAIRRSYTFSAKVQGYYLYVPRP